MSPGTHLVTCHSNKGRLVKFLPQVPLTRLTRIPGWSLSRRTYLSKHFEDRSLHSVCRLVLRLPISFIFHNQNTDARSIPIPKGIRGIALTHVHAVFNLLIWWFVCWQQHSNTYLWATSNYSNTYPRRTARRVKRSTSERVKWARDNLSRNILEVCDAADLIFKYTWSKYTWPLRVYATLFLVKSQPWIPFRCPPQERIYTDENVQRGGQMSAYDDGC